MPLIITRNFLILFSLFSFNISFAGVTVLNDTPKTLTLKVSSKYMMGDADSMIDARTIAMLEAKRSASEYAGTLIESETVVEDYEVTSDEVRTYATAFMKVKTLSENRKQTKSGAIKLILEIRAEIDKTSMIERIGKMVESPNERDNINQISEEKQRLQMKMSKVAREIRAANKNGDIEQSEKLTAQRTKLLKDLNNNFNLTNKNITELSDQIRRNHAEQKELLKEGNKSLEKINRNTTKSNKFLESSNKAIVFNMFNFNNALIMGDIETLDSFRKSGRDLGMASRAMMPSAYANSMIVNAVYQNHNNIDELLNYLVKHKAIKLNSLFSMSSTDTNIQRIWHDDIKQQNTVDTKKRKKQQDKYNNLKASYDKKYKEYKNNLSEVNELAKKIYMKNLGRDNNGNPISFTEIVKDISEKRGLVVPKYPNQQLDFSSSQVSPVQTAKIPLKLAAIWANNKQAISFFEKSDSAMPNKGMITLADGRELNLE